MLLPRRPPRLLELAPEGLDKVLQLLLVGLQGKRDLYENMLMRMGLPMPHLLPVVEAYHPVAAVLDVVLLHPQHVQPGGVVPAPAAAATGQGHPQLPGGEVDAGDGHRLGGVTNEHVGTEAVVHEVPVWGGRGDGAVFVF